MKEERRRRIASGDPAMPDRPMRRRCRPDGGGACRSLILLLGLCLPAAAEAGESAGEILRSALGPGPALVVQVGAGDGSLAADLASAGPWVVAAIAADATTAERIRDALRAGGTHGQATAMPVDRGRVPIADWLADAAVVEDPELVPATEIERLVRPGGTVLIRTGAGFVRRGRPRPPGIGSWPMYNHDAAGTNASDDQLAGPGRGLRWMSGPQHRSDSGTWIADAYALVTARFKAQPRGERKALIMRNAFNGLTLWQRDDLWPIGRYAVVLTPRRLYVMPDNGGKAAVVQVVDPATGTTIQALDQGVALADRAARLAGAGKEAKSAERALDEMEKRDRDATLLMDPSGRQLLTVANNEAAMVDAESGRRLWAASPAGSDEMIVWPLIADDLVILPEGTKADGLNYTHWPMITVKRIRALALKDGAERWTWRWPEGRPTCGLMNAVALHGRLALNLRSPSERQPGGGISGPERPQALSILDLASGKELSWQTKTPFVALAFGGHSGSRIIGLGDRLWNTSLGEVIGAVSIADPTTLVVPAYKHGRPAGCTAFRATPNWIIGNLAGYPVERPAGPNPPIEYYGGGRNDCDVGSFPANGLLYLTPNHCFCGPYLPGNTAYHSQRPLPSDDAGRLQRGTAAPSAGGDAAGWPMLMQGADRANWTDDALPRELAQLWTTRPVTDAPKQLQGQWDAHFHIQGPVTGISIAGAIAAFAGSHRQFVIACDPATGRERWRTPVDGRIDSQPTIAGGMVYAGTANGYVYALARDSGALVWRYRIAPREERILVNGGLESPWPIAGSVVVDKGRVIAVAGRHSEVDGGLWWAILDAGTGTPLASGRIGQDEPLVTSNMYTTGWAARGRHPEAAKLPRPAGNNVPILSGDRLLIPGAALGIRGDGLVREPPPAGRRDYFRESWESKHVLPGNLGLLNRYPEAKGGMLMKYGGVTGRIFSIKGPDFLVIGSSISVQNRGGEGGDQVVRHRALPGRESVKSGDANSIRYADVVWQGPKDTTSDVSAMIVAGNSVVVGRRNPAVIDVLDYATGERRQRIEIPSPVIVGGLSSDGGRLFAALEEGTIIAFGAR